MYPQIKRYRASTFYILRLPDEAFQIEIVFDSSKLGTVKTGGYKRRGDAEIEAQKIVDLALSPHGR
jgi:hypothetical protein